MTTATLPQTESSPPASRQIQTIRAHYAQKAIRFPLAVLPDVLPALNAASHVSPQCRFTRAIPGVREAQCPACGMLTAGPRAGWTPARHDASGYLRPVWLDIDHSATCPPCQTLTARLARLDSQFTEAGAMANHYRAAHARWLKTVAGVA